ncbi:A-factor biosynthesis hotdog domain protein [Actinomadura rubteroloni]|uniref:A-factor biosynthesis hotdog domain protein n=1 Tax=Actinomadura rubteroloni TaxID=1926885 RepID=A0A2P4UMV0_9ACTN|nr:AfsA-related hotdog domain-containing protein [Actinomadura rubteroloni]POM26376.1 A-factor biosynthesis hotdog domain protein [Actinomadura rubteroloni]
MTPTKLCVVGDRFAPFADGTGALTVSGLVAALRARAYEGDLVLIEGQGIDARDWERIRAELTRAGVTADIRENDTGPLARDTEIHKHREENVLIAGLEQTGETTFRAALRLHNDEELLLDHQGGHVQGMVVLEAARQMFLAVSERYHASRWPGHRYGYVLESMETKFRTFLYPLAATIEYEVLSVGLDDPEHLTFDVRIHIMQSGLPAATIRMVCSAVHADALAHKEQRGAARALRLMAAEHTPSLAGGNS